MRPDEAPIDQALLPAHGGRLSGVDDPGIKYPESYQGSPSVPTFETAHE